MDPAWMDDYFRGVRDCAEGKPEHRFVNEAYRAGYAAQYTVEQTVTHAGLIESRLRGEAR